MKTVAVILCLMLLMGCTKSIVKTEYIKQEIPPLPEPPQYFDVHFQKKDGFYCVTPDDAKNLLKNREIDKAYMQELRTILEGLNNGR